MRRRTPPTLEAATHRWTSCHVLGGRFIIYPVSARHFYTEKQLKGYWKQVKDRTTGEMKDVRVPPTVERRTLYMVLDAEKGEIHGPYGYIRKAQEAVEAGL